MKLLSKAVAATLCLSTFFLGTVYACPSEATLNIRSSNYRGVINIELRKGVRPGSQITATNSVNTSGTVVFRNVCPGRYFYAFSTPDSQQVSTTQYFDVIDDGDRYSMPEITVTYSRSSTPDTQRVGTAKRSDL